MKAEKRILGRLQITVVILCMMFSLLFVCPDKVYAAESEKSVTLTGNVSELLDGTSENPTDTWSMQVQNHTGKSVLFYDLYAGNQKITSKQAFNGDTLVLKIEDYDGSQNYSVTVYGVDKSIQTSARLYQVQADVNGTSVPMANGIVTEAEGSTVYHASESCVVEDIDYDLNQQGDVTVSYDDQQGSSGYHVAYTKHDSTTTGAVHKAQVRLVDEDGNALMTNAITYYGTYTYQAPRSFSKEITDADGNKSICYYTAIDGKAQAVLTAEDEGKTVQIAYRKADSETAYEWKINLVDLLSGKTLETVTRRVGVDTSVTYDAASEIQKDGETYTLDESMAASYTHQYGDAEHTTNIYYYNKDKWTPEDGYDVTVRYVNIADRSEIFTQTVPVTNAESAVISCPSEYEAGGRTYIRLKGQSDTISHSYYSSIRQYTIYYRDSQDTIYSDAEIRYITVDGQEITVDNVIYRVVPGTTVAVMQNNTGSTSGDASDGNGTDTTILGDGNTEGTTSEVVQSADDQVPLANQKLDNKDSQNAGLLSGHVLIGVAAALVLLICIIFGVMTKKRREQGR